MTRERLNYKILIKKLICLIISQKYMKRIENSASSAVNKVAGTTSSYTPNSGVAACRVGLLINRVQ